MTFTGYIKSRNPNCFDHRRVQLWRKSTRTSTSKKKVAYTYAEKRSAESTALTSKKWTITARRSGWYYSEVTANDECKGKKSRLLHYTRQLGG